MYWFFLSPFLPDQNCLRRRDAGLLNQLQELDKQISDLRLDVEKTSEEHLETDSRPSSGEGVSTAPTIALPQPAVLSIPRPANGSGVCSRAEGMQKAVYHSVA